MRHLVSLSVIAVFIAATSAAFLTFAIQAPSRAAAQPPSDADAPALDGGAEDAMADAEVDPLGAPKPPKPPTPKGCAVSQGESSSAPIGFALFTLGILGLRRRRRRAR